MYWNYVINELGIIYWISWITVHSESSHLWACAEDCWGYRSAIHGVLGQSRSCSEGLLLKTEIEMANPLIAWKMESDIFIVLLTDNSNISALLSSCWTLLASSQSSQVETLTSKVTVWGGGSSGRRLDHEGGALMNGSNALTNKGDPRELPGLFYRLRTQWERSSLWTRKRAHTRRWICQYLDLGLPSLENCEK